MKEFKQIFLLLLIVISVGLVSSCKDDDPVSSSDNLVGVWVLTKVIVTPLEFSPESLGMQATFDLRSDDTFTVTMTDSSGTSTQTGTWSATDSKVVLTSEGEAAEMPYTLSGNKLTVETVYDLSAYGLSSEQAIKLELTKQ